MEDLKSFVIQGTEFVISWEHMADTVWLRKRVGKTLNGILAVTAYKDGKYFSDGLDAKDFVNNKLIPDFNDKMDSIFPKNGEPQFDSEIERFKYLISKNLIVNNDRFEIK